LSRSLRPVEAGVKNSGLFERSEFPEFRQIQKGGGYPDEGGARNWAPFLLVRFLWASKENEHLYYFSYLFTFLYGQRKVTKETHTLHHQRTSDLAQKTRFSSPK